MLSAFKNFLVTFLIAALLFGAVGYFATMYLSDIITGILDGDTPSSTPVVNAPEDEENNNQNENNEDLKVPDGNSFTFLVLGTDYRTDIYGNYYRTVEDYQKVIEEAQKEAQKSEKKEEKDENKEEKDKDKEEKAEEKDKKDKTESSKEDELESVLETDVRYIRATWIAVVRADKENREFAVCYLSPETAVSAPYGASTLGEIYGLYGIDVLCEYIGAMTGLEMNYRFVLDGIDQLKFAETMEQEITFDLKCDLYAGTKYHLSTPDTESGEDEEAAEEGTGTDELSADAEPAQTDDASDTAGASDGTADAEGETADTAEDAPVLKSGENILDEYSVHTINTFREQSQSDIEAKSSYILEIIKKYLTSAAQMETEDLTGKIEELTALEGEYDINDPYSAKPVLATNFTADEVEYIHSMLRAVEYFGYTEFIYPGAYSESDNTYQPDIKSALSTFEKYRSTSDENEPSADTEAAQ